MARSWFIVTLLCLLATCEFSIPLPVNNAALDVADEASGTLLSNVKKHKSMLEIRRVLLRREASSSHLRVHMEDDWATQIRAAREGSATKQQDRLNGKQGAGGKPDSRKSTRKPSSRSDRLVELPAWQTSLLSCKYVLSHQHDELSYRERTFPSARRYASADWLELLRTWPRSVVLRRIRNPLIAITLWTAILAVIHQVADGIMQSQRCSAGLCRAVAQWFTTYHASKTLHSLIGPAMSLLLVFRTNSGYTRYWEGRGVWETLSAKSRDLTRLMIVHKAEIGAERCRRLAFLLCTLAFSLKQHLEGFHCRVADEDIIGMVELEDREGLRRAVNRPLHITNVMAVIIAQVPITANWALVQRQAMLTGIAELSKCIGDSEKLVQTPVPQHYTRHTQRFLSLFCLTMPLTVVADHGLFAVPLVALVVWCLYGVQEIGMLIDNPFFSTPGHHAAIPLDTLCRTIRFDVMEALAWAGLLQDPELAEGQEVSVAHTDSPNDITSDSEPEHGHVGQPAGSGGVEGASAAVSAAPPMQTAAPSR